MNPLPFIPQFLQVLLLIPIIDMVMVKVLINHFREPFLIKVPILLISESLIKTINPRKLNVMLVFMKKLNLKHPPQC